MAASIKTNHFRRKQPVFVVVLLWPIGLNEFKIKRTYTCPQTNAYCCEFVNFPFHNHLILQLQLQVDEKRKSNIREQKKHILGLKLRLNICR